MSDEQILEEIRSEIRKLQKEREIAILEKGLCAQFNNDLRENSQYDYWVDKEYYYSFKIQTLIKKADTIQQKKNKAKISKRKKTSKPVEKIGDQIGNQKNKWL
jgi:hypothetical protein